MDNKKAILVVSFGTSYKDTREKTIDKIETDIQSSFPDYKVYRAFTSKKIIKKLKKVYDLTIYNIDEAINAMLKDGITDLIVQPTHIINGIENESMIDDISKYKNNFNSIKIGNPLLTTTEDFSKVVEIIKKEFDFVNEDEALVCMGHGTEHHSNSCYPAIDYMFKEKGAKHFYMGTVEAYPFLETIVKHLKEFNPKKVYLMPFMIVAGDHAINDMAGDEEDSWKTILTENGYEVECILKGLGEYESIRKIYIKHIECAINK